jgi:hypothetical protein
MCAALGAGLPLVPDVAPLVADTRAFPTPRGSFLALLAHAVARQMQTLSMSVMAIAPAAMSGQGKAPQQWGKRG